MDRTLSGCTLTHTEGIEEPRAANTAQIPSCEPRAAPPVGTVQKGLWLGMMCDRAEEETALMSRASPEQWVPRTVSQDRSLLLKFCNTQAGAACTVKLCCAEHH